MLCSAVQRRLFKCALTLDLISNYLLLFEKLLVSVHEEKNWQTVADIVAHLN